jgi:hypothetical protein
MHSIVSGPGHVFKIFLKIVQVFWGESCQQVRKDQGHMPIDQAFIPGRGQIQPIDEKIPLPGMTREPQKPGNRRQVLAAGGEVPQSPDQGTVIKLFVAVAFQIDDPPLQGGIFTANQSQYGLPQFSQSLDPSLPGKQTEAISLMSGQNRDKLTKHFKRMKKAIVKGSRPEKTGRFHIETVGMYFHDRG